MGEGGDTFRPMTHSPDNSLEVAAPLLAAQWNHQRNAPLSPREVRPNSGKRVWWRCDSDHEWDAVVKSRYDNGSGCPVCSGNRVGYGNDLASKIPEIAKEWHPTLNGSLTASDVRPRSNKHVWWLCSYGHKWESIIANRTKESRPGCPYCSNQKVGYGNDLFSVNPDLAAEWHPIKNMDKKPSEVVYGARLNVWWKCANGHEWKAMVFKRNAGAGCEKCQPIGISQLEVRTFAELRHVLGDYVESIEHDTSIKLQSGRRLRVDVVIDHIAVEFDGSHWHKGKTKRDREKTALLVGEGFTVIRVREHPLELISETDIPIRRAPNAFEIAAAVLRQMMHLSLLEPPATAAAQRYLDGGISKASAVAKVLLSKLALGDYGERSLAACHPDVAAEWHPTRNDRTPSQVTARSGERVWWLCPKGHDYEAVVGQRTADAKPSGCGYCSGRYVTPETSLAVINPDLAVQLHPTLNPVEVTAESLVPHSRTVVWWLCTRGHATQDSVSNRTKGMVCQRCPNARRRGADEGGADITLF